MKKNLCWTALTLSLLGVLMFISACVSAAGVKIQVCLVIDGSGSISSSEWDIIKQALAKAVNETIPHDGSVELSIVQFGYSPGDGYAKTEISPTIIENTNYVTIAAQISIMPKGNGNTPTAHGLYLGWSGLKNSPNFGAGVKQVINLATDDVPNVRNNNATADLDGSGGSPNSHDDVIATVNSAVAEGLDELDVEGIGIADVNRDWFKDWAVRPQPGIMAPPFTKQGWIRIVADPAEFADTVGQKLQVIISGDKDIWEPPAEQVLAAGLFTVGITSVISSFASALSNPETFPMAQKITRLLPETLKRWLHEFISSKRKLVITQKRGHTFALTKLEIVSYVVGLSVLTLAFSYAKAQSLDEIFSVIPTILATSILVEFVKNFAVEVIARSQGVWTEHRLWYFGLAAFLLSTLAFRFPFSSPSRNTHYSSKFTKRSLGLVSSASIFVGLAFAIIFYVLLVSGFALIGSIGLVMSLTLAFFEALPIPPMNGKDIYDWSKLLWTALFVATFAFYVLCLLLI
ncbi:MAG TPA: VWA domain-containing protein [Candidatus Bathyarchaeia archaeon]